MSFAYQRDITVFWISANNCDSDILRNFPNDLTLTSSSELYHGDSNHDYSANRGHLDTVETTTRDGVQHMGAWSANFNNMLQHIQVGDWHTCMHASFFCMCVCFF
jgi:hypothetical protein